jgi:hypothetical protein
MDFFHLRFPCNILYAYGFLSYSGEGGWMELVCLSTFVSIQKSANQKPKIFVKMFVHSKKKFWYFGGKNSKACPRFEKSLEI